MCTGPGRGSSDIGRGRMGGCPGDQGRRVGGSSLSSMNGTSLLWHGQRGCGLSYRRTSFGYYILMRFTSLLKVWYSVLSTCQSICLSTPLEAGLGACRQIFKRCWVVSVSITLALLLSRLYALTGRPCFFHWIEFWASNGTDARQYWGICNVM
jgi:hypothetical protein